MTNRSVMDDHGGAISTGDDQLATFRLDGMRFGIDVTRVQEVVRARDITSVPLAPAGIAGLLNLRGRIVTVIDVRSRLGLGDLMLGDDGLPAADPVHFIVDVGGDAVSLLVDREDDVVGLAASDREEVPSTIGATLRGFLEAVTQLDGDILLVLDLDRLLSVAVGSLEVPRASIGG